MATVSFSHFLSEQVGVLVFSMSVGYFTSIERLLQLQLYALSIPQTLFPWIAEKICIFQLYKP